MFWFTDTRLYTEGYGKNRGPLEVAGNTPGEAHFIVSASVSVLGEDQVEGFGLFLDTYVPSTERAGRGASVREKADVWLEKVL